MRATDAAAAYITQQRGADYLIGLKGNQSGILERAQIKLPQEFFPCGHDSGWVKEHGRLTRWRIQRKCVSPEEAGLCGCLQFVAVWRERHYLRGGRVYQEEQEYSYYVSSTNPRDYREAALLDAMRGHWDAVENGFPTEGMSAWARTPPESRSDRKRT